MTTNLTIWYDRIKIFYHTYFFIAIIFTIKCKYLLFFSSLEESCAFQVVEGAGRAPSKT
jgi:hypothetical protein